VIESVALLTPGLALLAGTRDGLARAPVPDQSSPDYLTQCCRPWVPLTVRPALSAAAIALSRPCTPSHAVVPVCAAGSMSLEPSTASNSGVRVIPPSGKQQHHPNNQT